MRVLTLNVANPPADRAKGLLEWLWHQPDELLVLTEVGRGKGSQLIGQVCRAAGYDVHASDPGDLGVLIVSRDGALTDVRGPEPAVLPGRVKTVATQGITVLGVYGAASDPVRYSSKTQRQRKRDWLTAYDDALAAWLPTAGPTLMIGDLNLVDPVHDVPLKYVLSEETAVYEGLSARHDLTDAYRLSHPDEVDVSWVDHSGVGCRYDHAFVTADLRDRVAACDLDHGPRESGLTDHSALRIDLLDARP
ncbi:endonuclease/exonuclease/phosphatase family protein [Luteipulveratus halotolerans]|uniref:Endonuclease/exonuclease/phosphatase domain-containing protein n=1 Tax=Luteipulveratus halotolerans TaxID=1631356 RepID=A0A0L6CLJ4_9MICO|nr:endonuclease/exonuclease/phosphatase family protein [Luteipulveratus halotolerans]KNX38617.1 hypothetical protein VV01_18085 [Luteipulveratus halotolerans]